MTERMITVGEAVAEVEQKFEAMREELYAMDLGDTKANESMRAEADRIVNDGLARYYVMLQQHLSQRPAGTAPMEGDKE